MRRRPRTLVIAAVVIVAAAACSDDDSGSPGADPTGSPTVTTLTTSPPTSEAATTAPATTGTTPATSASATSASAPTTSKPASWFEPELTERECPADFPRRVRCSTLTVAADRADPDGGTIELPVGVYPARRRPASGAIVIPAGGPGGTGFETIGSAATAMNRTHDVVVYDQRGTGEAVPNLDCPANDRAFVAALRADRSYERERDAMTAARNACRDDAEAQGIDLTDYQSEASATDLDELRAALGYDTWTILGISYGGRLALATMRSYPDGIESVILDSVYDVTYGGLADTVDRIERAFAQLADGCAADRRCRRQYGDLSAALEEVRRMYNASPAVTEADLGEGLQRFVITGDDMYAGLFNALYDASLIPILPSVIDGLRRGETGVLPVFIEDGVPFATGFADTMQAAVDCGDNAGLDVHAADEATFVDPGPFTLVVAQLGLCPSDWPATPGDFNEPVESDIPALVLAGSYDPITPPAGTEAVAERLANSTFVLVEPVGHGATGFDECITGIELAFLADPTTRPDTSCADEIPPPDFQ